MSILRFIKSNWYLAIGVILIIVIFIIPKSTKNESKVYYNTNHEYKEKISVYVDGEVRIKGKMYFYKNDTVVDLIRASGLTDYSNVTGLKSTEILVDGSYYTISIISENEKSVSVVNKSTTASTISRNNSSSKVEANDSNKININKASETELQTLPSIGQSRAKSIITYREINGDFNSIEELKNVGGISDAIYDEIKDYITC